jgi:hypothetical protein
VAYLQLAGNMNERIVVVIKRLGRRQYQAHLRAGAGSTDVFWSQHHGNTVRAKREAEAIFGVLRWLQPPDEMTRSEPEMMWIAYVSVQTEVSR